MIEWIVLSSDGVTKSNEFKGSTLITRFIVIIGPIFITGSTIIIDLYTYYRLLLSVSYRLGKQDRKYAPSHITELYT